MLAGHASGILPMRQRRSVSRVGYHHLTIVQPPRYLGIYALWILHRIRTSSKPFLFRLWYTLPAIKILLQDVDCFIGMIDVIGGAKLDSPI